MKRVRCKTMQRTLKTWFCLHSADVGADIIRPQAIDNRAYRFFRRISVFCSSPIFMHEILQRTVYVLRLYG